jgi:2-polyprenyl-6-methoxyphenol hydroxylase-like FAD-dependent oxidoreductase
VETTDHVLRGSGLAGGDVDTVAGVFDDLLDGHQLFGVNPRWGRFLSVRNERWSHGNLVLLGDAAHTTHFSIGSGTKLAMEDAVALAMALTDHRRVPDALAAYQAARQPAVARLQRVAETSRDWFERVAEHVGRPHEDFALHLLTRSGRISHRDLPLADRAQVDRVRAWFAEALAAAS